MSLTNVREYRRAIKSGKSRETGCIGYTRRRQTKQKHNPICVGHHYSQANTNNVSPTNNWRYRRNEYRFYAEIVTDVTTRNVKTYIRTTQKMISHTDPTKKNGVEPRKGKQFLPLIREPAMLHIQSICVGHHFTQTNTNNVNKT